eukprot:g18.t1
MRQFFRLTKMCIIITAGADSQSQQSSTYELLQNVDSEAASDTEIQDLATDDGRHPFKGGYTPQLIRISDKVHIRPPAIVLQAIYFAPLFLGVHLWVLFPALPCLPDSIRENRHLYSCMLMLPWCLVLSKISTPLLLDGGILAVFSMYVIVASYIQVNYHEECAKDLRKTYKAILELPLKPLSIAGETWWEWLQRQLSNVCVDFLSSSRLLIAWAEDWPQGILGLVIVLKNAEGIGFAGISAAISFSKGFLIPVLQRAMFEQRKLAVQEKLEALVSSQGLKACVKRLNLDQSSQVLTRGSLPKELQGLLKEPSVNLLKGLNVSDADLFQPIRELQQTWLQELERKPETLEEFENHVAASYLEKDASGEMAEKLSKAGYMRGDCRVVGFTALQCKKFGCFTAKKCKDAGFTAKECKDAGFTAKECEEAGFLLAEAGFSAKELQEDGFSARQCSDAGFTAKECKDAGYSAERCKDAGFSAKDFYDAGFSTIQCRILGFEKAVVYEARFSLEGWELDLTASDYRSEGFTALQCKKLGCFTAKACKDAGFTAKECKDAGFTAVDCKEAGFSVMECHNAGLNSKEASFPLRECLGVRLSHRTCKWLGYSVRDFKAAHLGLSATECKELGFPDSGLSALHCKEAGFSAKECKDGGFSALDCSQAGFSYQHMAAPRMSGLVRRFLALCFLLRAGQLFVLPRLTASHGRGTHGSITAVTRHARKKAPPLEPFAFEVDETDHCETPSMAYKTGHPDVRRPHRCHRCALYRLKGLYRDNASGPE